MKRHLNEQRTSNPYSIDHNNSRLRLRVVLIVSEVSVMKNLHLPIFKNTLIEIYSYMFKAHLINKLLHFQEVGVEGKQNEIARSRPGGNVRSDEILKIQRRCSLKPC